MFGVSATASFAETTALVAALRGKGPQNGCTAIARRAQEIAANDAPRDTGALQQLHYVIAGDGSYNDYADRLDTAAALRPGVVTLLAVAPPRAPGAVMANAAVYADLLEYGSAGGKVAPQPWFTHSCELAKVDAEPLFRTALGR